MSDNTIKDILDFGPLEKGRFVERPNRFLVRCDIKGRRIDAHLPNPGRLWELLLPGATVYLSRKRAPRAKGVAPRTTKHTLVAVERAGRPVFLHTHATNRVARFLIEQGMVPSLAAAKVIREEVTVERSRFDFFLRHQGREVFLEVKSCTLFGNGIAMFPDAVTARGKKHLQELANMGKRGASTAVLFLVHYPHVDWFMPDYHTDLEFSQAMLKARRDVGIIGMAVGWNADLTLDGGAKTLEIPWAYLAKEVKDCGAYLVILECKKERHLTVGKLGRHTFQAGYYIYVGSAMKGLSARIARHRRRRKTRKWHIDYLSAVADKTVALPIRSSQQMECEVAKSLSASMATGPSGFGSSDCPCPSHLFWSPTNPLHERAFHDMLQGFRMRTPCPLR